jgi:FG-GAP repeat
MNNGALTRRDGSRFARVGVALLALTGTYLGTVTNAIASPTSGDTVRRPFVVRTATPVAALRGSDTTTGDYFGSALAISGSTAVVGAPGHGASAGRAYVFKKSALGWEQTAELVGADTAAGDSFGFSVAIDGGFIVVGAPDHQRGGRAYVFAQTSSAWRQVAELEGLGPSGLFGYRVAISGTTIAVGGDAPVLVFTKTPLGWAQTGSLKGSGTTTSDAVAFMGGLAISGATVVVGEPHHGSFAGRVYVFARTLEDWRQAGELQTSGPLAHDGFGNEVALSGSTLVVDQVLGGGVFAPYLPVADVYTRATSGWHQTAQLTFPNGGVGGGLALSGRTIVVDNLSSPYVFTETPTGWQQTTALKAPGTTSNDDLGLFAIDISGSAVLIGDDGHASDAGRVYVFRL